MAAFAFSVSNEKAGLLLLLDCDAKLVGEGEDEGDAGEYTSKAFLLDAEISVAPLSSSPGRARLDDEWRKERCMF